VLLVAGFLIIVGPMEGILDEGGYYNFIIVE